MKDKKPQAPPSRKALLWVLFVALAIGANSIFWLSQYYQFQPDGTPGLLVLAMLMEIPLALALLAFTASVPALFIKSWRREAIRFGVASLIYVVCATFFMTSGLGYRRAAFDKMARQAAPVVAAIERYATEQGKPPASLETLHPDYLPTYPPESFIKSQEYQYLRIEAGEADTSEQNPTRWILYIKVIAIMTDWNTLLYDSAGRPEEFSRVDPFFRIGEWAVLDTPQKPYVQPYRKKQNAKP
ncbi:MAG: hypothetical protein ACLFUS_15830 [Candidatus Sumerlaeia bacterium]